MSWRLGTIGFAYPEWNGGFYPAGMGSGNRLGHYAGRFGAVELDTTFYAIPPENVVRRWAAVTPSTFRFSLKAPQACTHYEVAKPEELTAFLDVAALLGPKLGCILLQFPRSFGPEYAAILEIYLGICADRRARVAVELRNRSWWFPRFEALLRSYNAAWVASDQAPLGHAGSAPGSGYRPLPFRDTADFLYVRWCGRHGQYERDNDELYDCTPRLAWWRSELGAAWADGREAFGFFGNSFAGYGPGSARRLQSMLGLPDMGGLQPSLFEG